MRTIGRLLAFIRVHGLIVIGAASLFAANALLVQVPVNAAAAPARAVVPAAASSCTAQADQKKLAGAARTAFLKKCEGAHATAEPGAAATAKPGTHATAKPGLNSQQQKMVTCNQQAKKQNLKGDARKKFMSTCLKKH